MSGQHEQFEQLAETLSHEGSQEEKQYIGMEEFAELAKFFPEGTTPEQMAVYIEHETEANKVYALQ